MYLLTLTLGKGAIVLQISMSVGLFAHLKNNLPTSWNLYYVACGCGLSSSDGSAIHYVNITSGLVDDVKTSHWFAPWTCEVFYGNPFGI